MEKNHPGIYTINQPMAHGMPFSGFVSSATNFSQQLSNEKNPGCLG